jgi:excisionase family DNA binding protein
VSVPTETAFGEPLLSAEQLAKVLGRSRRWVYRQAEEGGLPHYKLGRSVAFEVSAVRRWLEDRRVGAWPVKKT